MKYVICAATLIVTLIMLVSCGGGQDASDVKDDGTEKIKAPTPAGYAECDVKYSVSITDGTRVITVDAERTGNVTRGVIVSPSELQGTVVTDDVEGMRIFTDGGSTEFMISSEASAGLEAVFGVMSREVKAEEFTSDGEFVFSLSGYTVRLTLSHEGYPLRAVISAPGSERIAEYGVEIP